VDPIRIEAAAADSPTTMALLAAYFAELAARFPDGFAAAAAGDELSPPDGIFLVAWSGGNPMGCGGIRRLDDTTAEVKHMWVDPRWRGRGVARSLLTRLEAAAAALGYRCARLDTSVHLPEAVALYRNAGWTETPPYNDNPYAGHWFLRDLGEAAGYDVGVTVTCQRPAGRPRRAPQQGRGARQ
jgi:GNAT superfamily N-acetyltransferase